MTKRKVEPPKNFRQPLLSEEHCRQIARFTGMPCEPEEHRRLMAWVAYKRWYHETFTLPDLAEAARLKAEAASRRKLSRKAKAPKA